MKLSRLRYTSFPLYNHQTNSTIFIMHYHYPLVVAHSALEPSDGYGLKSGAIVPAH